MFSKTGRDVTRCKKRDFAAGGYLSEAPPLLGFYLGWSSNFVSFESVGKFIVPYWGIQLTPAQGLDLQAPAYVAWRAGTTTNAGVNLIPPVRDYECGYWSDTKCKTSAEYGQGVTKRCRLSWRTNSALVYQLKCGGGELRGSQPMSTAVHMEPK